MFCIAKKVPDFCNFTTSNIYKIFDNPNSLKKFAILNLHFDKAPFSLFQQKIVLNLIINVFFGCNALLIQMKFLLLFPQ